MKTSPPLFASIFLFAAMAFTGRADIVPEGGGIIFGEDHVFSLEAPKGWVLDNESGLSMGLHAVFYPKGSTWKDSKIVAYARSRPLDDEVKNVEDQVASVIKHFHSTGHPDYEGKKAKTIETEGDQKGTIYHFSGDQWGNYEAVCYFTEKKTINYVVLNCRDKKSFEGALEAFEALGKSYLFINDKYEKGNPVGVRKPLKKQAKPDGKKAAEPKKEKAETKKEATGGD